MKVSHTDPARQYLEQLSRLTSDLPNDARDDLVASIEEHLTESRLRGELEAALVRLGPPEEVARAARMDSGRARSGVPGLWLVWLTAVLTGSTVAGFAVLGALLSMTARFDQDADWNVPPALALLAASGGLLVGLFATIAAAPSRSWRTRDKLALTGLWIGSAVLAFLGPELAMVSALGIGFIIAGGELLLGGLGALAAVALAVSAARSAGARR